jgi:hypothetical protein
MIDDPKRQRPAEPPHEDATQQDNRVTSSLAGLAVILGLVVICFFLVKVLQKQSALEDCLMSGRTNCAPIETGR